MKDIRQEPPIPVERVIVTEKPSVEKSDKVAMDTLVPEVKEMVETVKTLNENANVQSQIAVNTDIAKLDESVVTLKAEEKIKIIEEKERAMDLQRNDNLINLDAIKKEESELAADGDVANVRAAERHEQLRKTLEKHKLEQRQMMQEQKEILKDIKEQKQEFEREKQRMAKDEVLKKSEKSVQINAKENVLPQKDTLSENDGRAVENNEVDVEKSIRNKETLEDKDRNKLDEIKLNEKLLMPDNANNVNVVAENNEKKSDLFQETSRNKNAEEEQTMFGNGANEAVLDREAVDLKTPEKPSMRKNEIKMGRIKFNDTESMNSPILNVLSKGTLQRSVGEEGLAKESDNRRTKEEKREAALLTHEAINASDKLQGKLDDSRYSVPVALKMTNQSRTESAIVTPANKSEPVVQAIRRDILENYEREKRDVGAESPSVNNNAKVSGDHRLAIEKSESRRVKEINDADSETCLKLGQDSSKHSEAKESEFEKRTIKSSTTEASLIKTNVYLSEQGIRKTISMDPRAAGFSAESMSTKQRYLKTSRELHKDNIEI